MSRDSDDDNLVDRQKILVAWMSHRRRTYYRLGDLGKRAFS